MTITLRPWAAFLLVAALGVLVGLAVGQLTQAQSNTVSQMVAQQKQTNRLLTQIKAEVLSGNQTVKSLEDETKAVRGYSRSIETETKKIRRNSYLVCREQTPYPHQCDQ